MILPRDHRKRVINCQRRVLVGKKARLFSTYYRGQEKKSKGEMIKTVVRTITLGGWKLSLGGRTKEGSEDQSFKTLKKNPLLRPQSPVSGEPSLKHGKEAERRSSLEKQGWVEEGTVYNKLRKSDRDPGRAPNKGEEDGDRNRRREKPGSEMQED